MARSRNIKPGFFKNEILGTADPFLSLLFSGLWIFADKKGILEDRPLRLKAEIFPYRENIDINCYLTDLERLGFIYRYKAIGLNLIQIINFSKHQNPHHTERDSIYPEYSNGCAIPDTAPLNNGSTPADSLNTDSLNTDSIRDRRIEYPEEFEEVWHAYPKRSGANKKETYKAWNARIKSGTTLEEMADGARRYAAYCKANNTEEKYIKQPSTFFGPSEHFLSEWRIIRSPMSKQDSLRRTGDLLTGRAREDATITIDVD